MSDYTPPTPEQLAAALEAWLKVQAEYLRINEAMTAIGEACSAASGEYVRLEALSHPAREYIIDALTSYTFTRKATGKRIAPHHDPEQVAQVLGELESEGLARNDPRRGWVWIGGDAS